MATLAEIYDWFMTSKKPTQAQFWASWGSFWNKNESIPQSSISGLTSVLNAKVENDQFNAHKGANDAHAVLFQAKEDKTQKGAPGGYAPLDEFTKLAAQYLNIVNDLVTGGATALLSAEQGKILQTQVNAINTLLTSDNVNLDTVQELVDAIETVQLSLNTILVNDLTTGGTTKALTAEMGKLLQTNKVDKVAGERLINAAEITKLAGLSNVVTTVKTILSTALATQDIAGFVTYINTLAAPLVVGANEIVEYKTSDTGRVFKLLLRGRSFGVGQPAIVAADVIETTEFLNKDIRLSNYPSTRIDGQLPTNKVLAPDVNGNLKLYTIATAPAPYLDELIPDSYLPNNTGNFILKGSFFTPNMTVVLQGQTINYKTFISDNEVRVNVTTGSAEGYFDVILDNGISATFSKALLIVLGTVYQPINSDWKDKLNVDVSKLGELAVTLYSTNCYATLDNTRIPIKANKNFRLQCNYSPSPLGTNYNCSSVIELYRTSDNVKIFTLSLNSLYSTGYAEMVMRHNPTSELRFFDFSGNYTQLFGRFFRFKRVGTLISYGFDEANLGSFTATESAEMYVKITANKLDFTNIKYIETA